MRTRSTQSDFRRTAPVAIVVFLLIAVASPALGLGTVEEPQQRPLSLGVLKGPTGLAALGLMEDNGPVSIEVFPSPDVIIARVLAGDLDLASLPTNVAARLYSEGIDYRLAGVTAWGALYLMSRDETIGDFSDLLGKEVHLFGRGATPDLVSRILLQEAGVAAEDLLLNYRFNQVELAQLLIAGQIETALLPEPFVTRVLQAGVGARIVVDLQDAWSSLQGGDGFGLPQGVLVAKSGLFANRRHELLRAVDAVEDSIEWVVANPELASRNADVGTGGLDIGLDPATAAAAIPRANLRFVPAAGAQDALEAYFVQLLELAPASIGNTLPDDGFYAELY